MIVKNFGRHNLADYQNILNTGGTFVQYDYCVSFIYFTSKTSSEIYLVRNNWAKFGRSIGFILLTILGGWWALPLGPIYTIQCLFINICGGRDVTSEVMESVKKQLNPQSQYF